MSTEAELMDGGGAGDGADGGGGAEKLELSSIIGFEGRIIGGMLAHPDMEHIIYPLGCKIIVESLFTSRQTFLTGHSNNISCLTCSPSGRYLASGQSTHMGFKADVIIWDFSRREVYCKLTLHKVKIQDLCFSPNEKYLATLGGLDDNSVVIWNVETKEAICGSQAAMSSAGQVFAIYFCNFTDDIFVTAGDGTLRVWELNVKARKIVPTECSLGQLKRIINCILVAGDEDKYVYCGTTTGDVLQVNIQTNIIRQYGPQKNKMSQGVTCIRMIPSGNFLLGTGDGHVVETTGAPNFKKVHSTTKLPGKVTSVVLREQEQRLLVGLDNSQIYKVEMDSFNTLLAGTCHSTPITSIAFPRDSSELFATSSRNDVRVWHTETGKELLRLSLPNLTCHAVDITPNGKAIITAWDDGKIRGFYPESGKPMYTIHDAHNKGVTALGCLSTNRHIVSGGGEGQVRIWKVKRGGETELKEALKEHKGTVTCIRITKSDEECVTSSTDGTCIIWDLVRFVRSQIIFANTMFKAVCYRYDECQIITGGTDRKIGYWETYDGSQIRELDGSKSASINGMDIYGDQFVTGGGDQLIKVWHYDEGEVTHVGIGHTGDITGVRISPNGQYIVSVSDDGAIFRWKFPAPSIPHATTTNIGIGSTEPPAAEDNTEELKIEEATQKE